MAIAPGDQRELALKLREMYFELELKILQMIAERVSEGLDRPDWMSKRLAEIRRLRGDVEKLLEDLERGVDVEVAKALSQAYINGQRSVDKDLEGITGSTSLEEVRRIAEAVSEQFDDPSIAFHLVETRSLSALAKKTINQISESHLMILRSTEDIYRSVVSQVAAGALSGAQTPKQVMQDAINKFADRGVSGFRDRAGRHWDIASYVEMAVRTSTAHAATQGTIDRLAERNHDLVIVSDHFGECDLCRPWEGKILSASGQDQRYRSLSEATAAGLFHPNCKHAISAYIEGVTEVPKRTPDPEGYKKLQKIKHAERMIRKWKKRLAVAVTSEEKKFVKSKLAEWNARYRELTGKVG